MGAMAGIPDDVRGRKRGIRRTVMKTVAGAAADTEDVKHMEIYPFERGSTRPVSVISRMRDDGGTRDSFR